MHNTECEEKGKTRHRGIYTRNCDESNPNANLKRKKPYSLPPNFIKSHKPSSYSAFVCLKKLQCHPPFPLAGFVVFWYQLDCWHLLPMGHNGTTVYTWFFVTVVANGCWLIMNHHEPTKPTVVNSHHQSLIINIINHKGSIFSSGFFDVHLVFFKLPSRKDWALIVVNQQPSTTTWTVSPCCFLLISARRMRFLRPLSPICFNAARRKGPVQRVVVLQDVVQPRLVYQVWQMTVKFKMRSASWFAEPDNKISLKWRRISWL